MKGVTIRCPTCPDHPVLTAPPETDTRRCIRCQGNHRWLALPHPPDHLCEVCRSECPRCDAPAGPGREGLCRHCAGRCRECGSQLPDRSDQPAYTTAPPLPGGDRPRLLFASTWTKSLCDQCQEGVADAERLVLRAFPAKLTRACGGHAPARAMYVIRAELQRRVPVTRLIERIERRWWQQWAHRPLARLADEETEPYGPDDVTVWLVVPTSCRGECEDGWMPDNPDEPCPVCRPRTAHHPITERSEVAADMAATARAALRAHKIPSRSGTYVPTAATAGSTQHEERLRQLAQERRARPAAKRRPEISRAEELADPTWAAAVKRARQERQNHSKRSEQ